MERRISALFAVFSKSPLQVQLFSHQAQYKVHQMPRWYPIQHRWRHQLILFWNPISKCLRHAPIQFLSTVKYGPHYLDRLLALLALGFTTSKAYDWRWRREATAPPNDPARITFTNTVAAVGLVEPSSENISVSTPVSGLVTAVHVKVGDHVRRGAPLFSLDDRDVHA